MIAVVAHIGVGDLADPAGLHVLHGNAGCRITAESLAPDTRRRERAIEGEQAAVLLHHAEARERHVDGLLCAAIEWHHVERRAERKGATVAGDEHRFTV